MSLSYWEYKTWLSNIDFAIVGSGIVGLNCALSLKRRFSTAKIVVLEKGILPQGASTKNAGFACFGSLSEILSDLDYHTEDEVYQLVEKRRAGIQVLRKNLGDAAIDFRQLGGYELFLKTNADLFHKCAEQMGAINQLLFPIFKANAFETRPNIFQFKNVCEKYILNPYEGQLDTGKMMANLIRLVQESGVVILNSVAVTEFTEHGSWVSIKTLEFEFKAKKLLIATNGFAAQLLQVDVKPARVQVLITQPIKDLQVKGTFHLDEGYFFFRNIDNRILIGGGRNLDFKNEETTQFGQTAMVQGALEKLLKEVILPDTPFELAQNWSGIMGMGANKRPVVKQISDRVYCGVRLGGMGIAIGSLIGQELADLV